MLAQAPSGRRRRGPNDSPRAKLNPWVHFLLRFKSELGRRRTTIRALHAARSFARTRPRLSLSLVLVLASLTLAFTGCMFYIAVSAACGCVRNAGLCRLLRKNPSECGMAMPDVVSEADMANDNGEGMLSYVGKDVAMEYGGVSWQLAQMTPPPSSRTEARIAYFVQIDQKSIVLLPRLFRRLHHPDNVYVLHVDAKVPVTERAFVRSLIGHNPDYRRNMHFLPSEMLTYRGFSMVLNTISAMTLACRVDENWDYFVNLSGADYPLISTKSQRQLLARPAVAPAFLNFVTFFPRKEWRPYQFRIKYQFWDPAVVGRQHPLSRVRRMISQRLYPLESFRRYTFTKAEAWVILSRPFCKFLVRSVYAKKMLLNHVHALSAPEHYFADVLYNHPVWRKTIVPDAFRKVVWYHHRRRSGQHPFLLDDRHRPPYDFWLYLKDTRSFFARKFSQPDAPLMDKVDLELSGSLSSNRTADAAMYDAKQRWFFGNIASHFDNVTKTALAGQAIQPPPHAYPKLS